MTLKELYKTADYKDSHGMLFHGDCLEIMKNIEDESIDIYTPRTLDEIMSAWQKERILR